MYKLAVIPSDPIEEYKKKGILDKLQGYYNPLSFFDKVYLFSPLETVERFEMGMNVVPVRDVQLKKKIRDFKIDIVRAYGGYWPSDMACNYKVNGIPVVVSVHDTNPKLLHQSIKKADIVFCVSEAVKKAVLEKYGDPERVWLLPNRVDLEIMQPIPKNEYIDLDTKYPFKYRILSVGRKESQKNLDTIIKALKILGEEYCLIAIGKGRSDYYLEMARNLGVSERCFFIDAIKNKELPRYYSWASCMCTPSRWEGFGIVFIEALACGSIVITSDIAPMNEYIKHGENGLLVKEYEDPAALASMLKRACTDTKLSAILMGNARESISRFDKNIIDKLEAEFYYKILKMKASGMFKYSFVQRTLNRYEDILSRIVKKIIKA